MDAREEEVLGRLARHCGIIEGYHDIWGTYHPTGPDTQREILRAMGLRVDSREDLEAELESVRETAARRLCEPVAVLPEGEPQELILAVSEEERSGEFSGWVEGQPLELRETGREPREEGAVRQRVRVALSPPLRPGIREVEISPGPGGEGKTAHVLCAVAPSRGYEARPLAAGAKLWGVNFPLYGLRSCRNWGIGDFQDLLEVLDWAAGLGADLLGLLPLHALFNETPYGVSPYYPMSRIFLNPIHLAVDRVPEAGEPEVDAFVSSEAVRNEAGRLRGTELVDHRGVWALKRRVLEACYRSFLRRHLERPGGPTDRGRDFELWRVSQGRALQDFATFCALREHLAEEMGRSQPWPEWPADLRSPEGPGVSAFREGHGREVGFHAYLQWLAEEQLASVRARAEELGMAVGLYLDLALGVDPCGADAWVYQDVLALGASAGAPPDPFSLHGQRWGVPPAVPERHRESGYRFFRDTLRRNASRAGAVRIDHVLALWRLYWVPGDLPASEGAYVADRAAELLALLRSVSREEECLVVGEDLGTVPPEVRAALMESGFYSYRLLIFEKGGDGRYRAPGAYPRQALVSVATHDLPTLDGFWLGRDLEVKRELRRYPNAEAERGDAEARRWDRFRLLEALEAEGLLPEGMSPAHEVPSDRFDDLAAAVHAFLARTPSGLMLANLDDLLAEIEMQNLPGTLDEHPNWRRKCRLPLEEWEHLERPRRIAESIRREGRGRGA